MNVYFFPSLHLREEEEEEKNEAAEDAGGSSRLNVSGGLFLIRCGREKKGMDVYFSSFSFTTPERAIA